MITYTSSEDFLMEELNLDNYECECKGKFKRFGRRTLNEYICTQCGLYVPREKMYKYEKSHIG